MQKVSVSHTVDQDIIRAVEEEAERRDRSRSYIVNEALRAHLSAGDDVE